MTTFILFALNPLCPSATNDKPSPPSTGTFPNTLPPLWRQNLAHTVDRGQKGTPAPEDR